MPQIKKETQEASSSRRQFLKGLGVAAATTAVAAGVSTSVQAAATTELPEGEKQTGYRETQHIRDYYDSL